VADHDRPIAQLVVRQLPPIRGFHAHDSRGSGRQRPPSSRYPAGWSGS
jgi:hypothetical protein